MSAVLEEHVAELCRRHAIRRTTIRGLDAGASRTARLVHTPAVRGQVSYLIALHEIAHVVGPVHDNRLENEAACWRWALGTSIVAPSARTTRALARRLLSYLKDELETGPERVPSPGTSFWSTLWTLEPDLRLRYERHAEMSAKTAPEGPLP